MTRRRIYNPAQLAPDELEASFVARHFELGEMLRIVREQPPDRPCQHFLLIGPRGMGKTTLGLRLLHKIEADPELSAKWQPVPFHEESYGISDIGDLWLTALRHLAHAVRDPKWADIADALSRDATDADRRAAYALDSLLDFRAETGMRLLLFVENLDMILDQIRDERANHALRAALMTRPDILLMGSACAVFPAIRNYDEALYEFFRLFILEGIDAEESRKILETVAAAENRPDIPESLSSDSARLEIIRRLTGGNPRLIVLACHLLVDSPAGEAFHTLERLIDEQTPYFKALVEQLPPQARKVFHCLAAEWTPMRAREIARAAHLSSSHVSAQLKLLVERGYAREIDVPGEKRTRYDVADRFYNMYHVLRFTRANRERLRRLVSFLHDLFGLPAMRATYAAILKPSQQNSSRDSGLSDAIAVMAGCVAKDVDYSGREDWLRAALDMLRKHIGPGASAIEEIRNIFDEQKFSDLLIEADDLYESGDFPGAESVYLKVVEADPNNFHAWLKICAVQTKKDRSAVNPLAFEKILDFTLSGAHTVSFDLFVYFALFAIDAYYKREQFIPLISVYERFAEYVDGAAIDWSKSADLRKAAADAHVLGGRAFVSLKRSQEAISCYERVLDTVPSDGSTDERAIAAVACLTWSRSLLDLDKCNESRVEWVRSLLDLDKYDEAKRDEAIVVSQRVAEYIRPDDSSDLRKLILAAFDLIVIACSKRFVAEILRGHDMQSREVAPISIDLTKYVSRDDPKELRRSAASLLSEAGEVYVALKSYRYAETACRAAMSIDPTFDGGWRGMAELLLMDGNAKRLPEMEECARKAARLAPDEPKNSHILFLGLASPHLSDEALINMQGYLRLHDGEIGPEARRRLALLLTMAAIKCRAEDVKKLMQRASLAAPMEPLWHAVRAETGENVEPLPAEVRDAVEDIRRQMRDDTVN